MSNTIDSRVVEMRFDNKNFESNVATSMSTLDKLKQKLKLDGGSKGLDGLNKASKKVDLSPIGKSIDTVQAKFSALQVIGTTALANITNSAVNAGKNIVKALTIEPVTTGLKEYETQINAVQTILANTQSKGTTLDQVNQALEELNVYADKTIYNFTEMTRNIGTFTAAGVDLETSVSSIQGIANLAAVSGSNSQQAATAMYQLSQALAAGTVKLMDWNSVVNAGMGGQVFQDSLKETARVHGVAIDSMIESEGSFRETLKDGWLTADILNETLSKFTATTEGLTDAQIAANREQWKSLGYTDEQIDGIFELGKTATDAATKVKTFTQMWDVIKETAQSGWAQTWKLIFGDFEEAKSLFTPLTEFFTGIINGFSKARNTLLEGALSSPFAKMAEKLSKVTEVAATASNALDKLKDYADVVNKVINGDYGVTQARWDKLTEEGYDWAHVQNLVNEKLGDSTRYATDYQEAQQGAAEQTAELTNQIRELSDEELRNLNFTEEEIKLYRELELQAKASGVPINKLLEDMSKMDGRTMLIESFKNIGQGLYKTFKAIGQAWIEIFPPMTSLQLYNIIAGFHDLSKSFAMTDETADNLKWTLKGIFAILDIVLTIVGGPIKIAFKLLGELLGLMDMSFLNVTAAIGKAVVKFRDMVDSALSLTNIFKFVVPAVRWVIDAIKELFGIEVFDFGPGIESIVTKIKNVLSELKNADNIGVALVGIGGDIIEGLVNGLKSGIGRVISAAIELARKIIDTVKGLLGIHSPSTVFMEIGRNIIEGLFNGLQNGFSKIIEFFSKLVDSCKGLFEKIDWGTVGSLAASAGFIALLVKAADFLSNLVSPLAGFGDMLEEIGDSFHDFGKGMKAAGKGVKHWMDSMALKNLAISILILAGSLVLLAQVPTGDLIKAGIAIGFLAGVIVILLKSLDGMSKDNKTSAADIAKLSAMLLAFSGALLIMSVAAKILGSMDTGAWLKGLGGMAAMVLFMAGFMKAIELAGVGGKRMMAASAAMIALSIALGLMAGLTVLLGKVDPATFYKGVGAMAALGLLVAGLLAATRLAGGSAGQIMASGLAIAAISAAIVLLAGLCVILGKVNPATFWTGYAAMVGLGLLVAGLIAATRLAGGGAGQILAVGITITAISAAMVLLAGLCVILGKVNPTTIYKGIGAMAALGLLVAGLIAATRLAGGGKQAIVAGATILAISVAMTLLAGLCLILSLVSPEKMANGIAAVMVLGALIALLIKMVGMAASGGNFKGVASTMLALSISIGILAGISVLLGLVDPAALTKGVVAVGVLSVFMMGLIAVTKYAGQCKGELIAITVAIGILAAAVVALSFITPDKLIPAVASMALLMAVFGGVIALSKFARKAMGTIIAIGAVIAALAGVLILMSKISDTSAVMQASQAISLLAVAAVPLTIAIAAFQSIPVGPALAAVGKIGLVIAAIGGVLVALGALNKIPGVSGLMGEGGNFLQSIGTAIGQFIGGIVGGVGQGVTSSLPAMGEHLSAFAQSIQGFISMMQGIDAGSMDGAKALAETILLLFGGELLSKISSFIGGGSSSLDGFGEQIESFGKAMVKFSKIVSGKIDTAGVEAAANAGKMMASLAQDIPNSGGVLGFIMGENDIDAWGEKLPAFGRAMTIFSRTVSGKIDPAGVEAAANAGKMMTSLAQEIPNSGGVLGFIMGENDIDDFGAKLVGFGKGIVTFSRTVSGKIDESAIVSAANAGAMMASLAKDLPNEGGMVSWFTGDNTLSGFAKNLEEFGKGIVKFNDTIKGKLDTSQLTQIGSFLKELTAIGTAKEYSLAYKGDEIVAFGDKLKELATKCSEINAEDFTKVSGAIEALAKLGGRHDQTSGTVNVINAITALASVDTSSLPQKGLDIENFGKNLSTFINSFSETEGDTFGGLSGAIDSLTSLATVDTTAITSAIESIGKIADIDVSSFEGKATAIEDIRKAISGFSLSDATAGVRTALPGTLSGTDTMNFDELYSLVDIISSIASLDTSSVTTISTDLQTLATELTTFKTSVSGITTEDLAGVTGLIDSVTNLGLSDSGGLQDITDMITDLTSLDTSALGTKGVEIKQFGTDLVTFNNRVSKMKSNSNVDAIIGQIEDIGYIDTSNFATLSTNLGDLGDGLSAYASSVSSISPDSMAGANSVLTTLGNLASVNADGISGLATSMQSLAQSGVQGFVNAFSGPEASAQITAAIQTMINNASAAVSGGNMDMTPAGQSIVASLANGVTASAATLSQAVTAAAQSGFTAAAAVTSQFRIPGAAYALALATGFKSGSGLLASAIPAVINPALSTASSYTSRFRSIGSSLGAGLAEGIRASLPGVRAAANELVAEADKAAKAKAEVNSPSKLFMRIGSSVCEGFAKGISDNTPMSNEAATNMAGSVLTATQKALKINSPSIVFKDEVGRYIVQGVAEGIKSDMSAEEQAEKKAQNIVNAFKKELDRLDLSKTGEELDQKLWEAWNPNASLDELLGRRIELQNSGIKHLKETEKLAESEFLETKEHVGENANETQEAYNKWAEAQIATIEAQTTELAEKITETFSKVSDNIKTAIEGEDLTFEVWEALYPNARGEDKARVKLKYLNRVLPQYSDLVALANQEYLKLLEEVGENHPETQEAYNRWWQAQRDEAGILAEIEEVYKTEEERLRSIFEKDGEIIEMAYELWEAQNPNADDETKGKAELAMLMEKKVHDQEDVEYLMNEYNDIVKRLGADSEEAKDALIAFEQSWKEKLETENRIDEIAKESLERKKEAAKEAVEAEQEINNTLASIADNEYNLWEKLYGKDASDEEKDARKLASLEKRKRAQQNLVNIANQEYLKAVEEFGENSLDASKAYDEYLQAQQNQADTFLDIISVYEEAEKRQRDLVDAQKIARTSYEDYMKKYRNYYLKNGLSLEDLENDALLVSGYDPDSTVKEMLNKTSNALDTLMESTSYEKVQKDFASLGKSYVTSVNSGLTESIPTVEATMLTLSNSCVDGLRGNFDKWVEAAKYLVQGFVVGINFGKQNAVNTVKALGDCVIEALAVTWKINSPSKVFAEMGKYAVIGLSKGLLDNAKSTADAAASVGENAVDHLKDTISAIATAIDSDMDVQPTIRPVLDLSDINAKRATLDTMFSRQQAMSVSAGMDNRRNAQIQNGNVDTNTSGNTYQFTQNNYSPKALSRTEIYRQTKNQFAAMKEATT